MLQVPRMLIALSVFMVCLAKAFGQTEPKEGDNFFVEPLLHYGKGIKNISRFPRLDPSVYGELNLGWQTLGKRLWNNGFGFPQYGISLFYGYQGNDSILGRTYSLVPNFALFAFRKKGTDLEIRLGSGLAYFPLRYDSIYNRNNSLIGSAITGVSTLSVCLRKEVSKNITVKAGISTWHFSNGHIQLPNVGLNGLYATVGVKYFPKTRKNIPERIKPERMKHPVLFNFRYGAGLHEFGSGFSDVDGPKYRIDNYSGYLSKRMGTFSKVHAGFIAKYYTSYQTFLTDSGGMQGRPGNNSWVIAYMMGHEFVCGRMTLCLEGGLNLYNPFFKYYYTPQQNNWDAITKTWFCSRLGFQYYVFRPDISRRFNIFLGAFINANFGQADYDEVTLGVVF